MKVIQASMENLEELAKLFDQYRVFYKQSSDLPAAKKFVCERLQKQDSTIFLALNEKAVGFTQLYPSFSSVAMKEILILNDLYVDPQYRKIGAAKALMQRAKDFAQSKQATKIVLQTAWDNEQAQALYESVGYVKNEQFIHYQLSLKSGCLQPDFTPSSL